MTIRSLGAATSLLVVLGCARGPNPADQGATGWPAYGGDAGGTRYSPLNQITRDNVSRLTVAWSIRTGDWSHKDGSQTAGDGAGCARCHTTPYKFEGTPITGDGRLYLSTPLNRVVALDPATGAVLWRWDAALDMKQERSEGFVSRGVAFWDGAGTGNCARRIFFGTVDARLVALDAATGTPCADFGQGGVVRLDQGVGTVEPGQYGVTSPPVVFEDLVVVGSSMGDNRRVDLERGTVRAFDARTGAERWSFDPIPRRPTDPGWSDWTPAAAARTGAANAWAPLSVDSARGLVFVPTGSAAPDFYGGERPGDNRFANSVVALEARTGKVVWGFQTVHHDLWDYDIAAQPSLVALRRGADTVPAVVAADKTGRIFVLDRRNGEPLFPVEERPVPASAVPGEVASPTQPFPTLPRPLHPHAMTEADVWGITPADRDACLAQFRAMRSGPIFTPPSLEGTVLFPGFGGGINWGGAAFEPGRQLLVVNTLRLAMWVKLAPRSRPDQGNQQGTPYTMSRAPLVAPSGLPCNQPPWGLLTAVDLGTGAVAWEVPLGRMRGLDQVAASERWGSINFGGPIVTAGGLVFIAAATDEKLRAFDVETGRELWQAPLPGGGQATPMTYSVGGRQYLLIAAGGHSSVGTTLGDHVVAYALHR